jgi:predicted alternative tryptophan synthase beta-subunit
MVVVPTSHNVSMVYASSGANEWGDRISQFTALLGLVTTIFAVRRWRKARRTARAS